MRLTLARYMPSGGVTLNKRLKYRNYNLRFSNKWHDTNELKVVDEGYKAACESKGIRVYDAQEVIRSHLPDLGASQEELDEYMKNPTQLGPIENMETHPFYNDRPCKTFNIMSRLIKHQGLDHAKVVTNAVEIQEGLPNALMDRIGVVDDLMPESEEMAQQILKDSKIFDATQRLLPKNVFVPNIGWNAVLDRLNRPLPYPDPDFSFGRKVRREYGIPIARQNLNVLRGLYQCFDKLSLEYPYLLERHHIPSCMIRQFFEKEGHLLRIYSPIHYMVTSNQSLDPYANTTEVEATKAISLPDISPMNWATYFYENHVYRKQDNFPFKKSVKTATSVVPQIHTAYEINNGINPDSRLDQDIYGRSLIMAFTTALGQAKLNYGSDISGELPTPITIHFINTNGKKYHFSVFQLNTLDLEGDIKNIFWHNTTFFNMYEKCGYIDAKPTLQGYNHDVFRHILGTYLQNKS